MNAPPTFPTLPQEASPSSSAVSDPRLAHMTAAVSLRGVDVTFRSDRGPVRAVAGLDLQIARQEFVSVVGRSGCGKSTILRVIAGLLQPTAGDVAVLGMMPEEARQYRSFGVVFQSSVMLPWLTALQNVTLPLDVIGMPVEKAPHPPRELLATVGLAGFEGLYPRQLSGGMRQRVAIARALSFDPPILLMDEPFAAVDALTRQRLHTLLLDICARTAKTVLFITHDVYEAVLLSDRVIVMSGAPGRVEASIDVTFPRPRAPSLRSDPEYGALCARILDLLMHE